MDLNGRDAVRCLASNAGADGNQNCEAVDCRRRRCGCDGVHQRSSYDGEDPGDDVEGEVVLYQRHENPLAHDEYDIHADEWEETNCGLEAGIAARELEIQRNEVDGYEEGRACCRRSCVEKDHGARFEEGDGKETVRGCGEDGEVLLDRKEDEDDEAGDERPDCAAISPCPCCTTECQRNDERDVESCIEQGSDPIELLELCEGWDSWLWLIAGDEDHGWYHETKDDEVDVEAPPPRCSAVCKRSTNNRLSSN